MTPLHRPTHCLRSNPAPSPASAIRHRLLERIADADTTHLTIDPDDGEWSPYLEGVSIKVLRLHQGVLSCLLRFSPGARLPAHRHRLDEECIVLEGCLRVGSQSEMGPGSYHLAHAGALHATISSSSGAIIFLRGAVPECEQTLESPP